MADKWIAGTKGNWHLARETELRGAKTGKVISRYLVTACTGRSLGGAWGHSVRDTPPKDNICPRCAAIAKATA